MGVPCAPFLRNETIDSHWPRSTAVAGEIRTRQPCAWVLARTQALRPDQRSGWGSRASERPRQCEKRRRPSPRALGTSAASRRGMSEASGTACITLAELDTFVAGDLPRQAHVGASVVVQQPNESLESVLGRLQRSAQVLQESGCRIASTSFLLGARSADRLTERLELARSLLGLMNDSSATLHLISTARPGEQEGLFELVGWLLADAHHSRRIRLAFRDRDPVACIVQSHQQLRTDPVTPVLDLTA